MRKPFFPVPPNIPILGVYFFDNFGFVIVLPLFAHLILDPTNVVIPVNTPYADKLWILGALLAAFPFAQFFGAPIFGQIADYFGKKRAFITTLSGMTLGYFFTALSLEIHSLWLLFFGRMVTGFFAANRGICLAAFSDHYSNLLVKRKHFGYLTTIEGISFTLSVMLGGWTSDSALSIDFSIALPIWITFGISFCSIFFILLTYQDKSVKKRSKISFLKGFRNIKSALNTPGVRPAAFMHFFLVLSWMTMLQFNAAFLIERFHTSLFKITITYIIVGVLWAIFSWTLFTLFMRSFPQKVILTSGFVLLSFVMFICFFSPNLFFYAVFLALTSCTASILWPSSLFLGNYLHDRSYHGKIQGIYQSMKSLALLIGPISMSFLLDFDINFLHLFTSFSAFLGLCTVFFFFKKRTIRAP